MKNKGYLIVPKIFKIFEGESDVYKYRGIDRNPLTSMELLPLPEENENKEDAETKLLLKQGLAKELEKYENEYEFIAFLENAIKMYQKIKSSLFDCELLLCLSTENFENATIPKHFEFVGYDVVAAESNFFSAIRNGLLGHLNNNMLKYDRELNEQRLFRDHKIAEQFLIDYLADVNSEKSEFDVYQISFYGL